MDQSLFTKLPAELRNQIYELVLIQDRPIIFAVTKFTPRTDLPSLLQCYSLPRKHPLALACTCRAIREDSIKVFFGENTFQIDILFKEWTEPSLRLFWKRITPANASFVRSVRVCIPNWELNLSSTVESLTRIFQRGVAEEHPTCRYSVHFHYVMKPAGATYHDGVRIPIYIDFHDLSASWQKAQSEYERARIVDWNRVPQSMWDTALTEINRAKEKSIELWNQSAQREQAAN